MDKDIILYVVGAIFTVANIALSIIAKLIWAQFIELKEEMAQFVHEAPDKFLTTKAFDRYKELDEKEGDKKDHKITQLFGKSEQHHVEVTEVAVKQDSLEARVKRIEDKVYK